MKMKLQYFADSDSANSAGSQAPASSEPASAASATAKYTQEDVNRMMAAKAKEVQASAVGVSDSQKAEWLAEGEKRAGMSAQEKAEAALGDQRKALEEQSNKLQARLDEADRRDALATTRTELTAKGIPAEFADFISEVDDDARNANLTKFGDLFKAAVDKAVDERVKGKVTPQTGAATGTQTSPTEFSKLTLSQQMALAAQDPQAYAQARQNANQ